MTEKELLYLEDAVGHEKNIIKICEDIKNNLEDDRLIEFIDSEIDIHNNLKDNLMNLLEVKSNE